MEAFSVAVKSGSFFSGCKVSWSPHACGIAYSQPALGRAHALEPAGGCVFMSSWWPSAHLLLDGCQWEGEHQCLYRDWCSRGSQVLYVKLHRKSEKREYELVLLYSRWALYP